MKKITVLASAVLSIVLYAAPQILRPEIVPGFSGNVPQLKYEKITPAPEYNAAGTLAFFLRPEGWDNSDNAWHFFCNNSKAGDKTLMIYRFANGNTRILLKKDKDNLADIIAKIPFANGKWTHIALSWQEKADKSATVFSLFVDGKKVKTKFCRFTMDGFPELRIGDVPTWRPYSKFNTTLGRIELHNKVLSEAEVAELANLKK